MNDGALDSGIATVTLAVDAVNDAPVAADSVLSALEVTLYSQEHTMSS